MDQLEKKLNVELDELRNYLIETATVIHKGQIAPKEPGPITQKKCTDLADYIIANLQSWKKGVGKL